MTGHAGMLEVEGTILLVQEDRFRLETSDGRGFLFILGSRSWRSPRQLARWSAERRRVRVAYTGAPDMGAVAFRVTPLQD